MHCSEKGSGNECFFLSEDSTYLCMENKELIDKLRKLKEEKRYTFHDLSRLTDIQVATLGRWFKTNHINKIYARVVKERLGLQ